MWLATGLVFFTMVIFLNAGLPALIPIGWVREHALVDSTGLGIVVGMLLGIFAVSFTDIGCIAPNTNSISSGAGSYQMHHAPARGYAGLDLFSSLRHHRFDLEGGIVNILILGIDPRAVALSGFAFAFMGMFQHWNVRTLYWFGFLIQRPEAHYRHHERDVHAYNYGSIPLWDMIFGTFYNPRAVPADLANQTGFSPGTSRSIMEHAGGSRCARGYAVVHAFRLIPTWKFLGSRTLFVLRAGRASAYDRRK